MEGAFDINKIRINEWRPRRPEQINIDLHGEEEQLSLELYDLEERRKELTAIPSQNQPENQNINRELEKLNRKPAIWAYGGNQYEERQKSRDWPEMKLDGLFQDRYGLNGEEISYGVGEIESRKFIVLRQRQNVWNRGGYPYTALFDPGEIVWRMAKYNAAAIVDYILENPELKTALLENPDKIGPKALEGMVEKMKHDELTCASETNRELIKLMEKVAETEDITVIGKEFFQNKPSPKEFARMLAVLKPEIRKRVTWLLGGGGVHGKAFGSKLVWDPNK